MKLVISRYAFLLVSSSLSSTSFIRYSFYFECKDKSFPFSTYAICAICVDSGNKVREIIMESFRRISPKDKKISPKDSTISPKDKKLSPKDSRISPKDKPR